MDYGRERVEFLEIDQPFCTLTYGVAPCTASLITTGTRKCFNTKSTCQDLVNFTPGTLTLRFCKPNDAVQHEYGPVLACVTDVSVSPGEINLGGLDGDSEPFGRRESITVDMIDFAHSDVRVDKYRLERPQPYSVSKGFESDSWLSGSTPTGYTLSQSQSGESSFELRVGPYGATEVVNVARSLDSGAGAPGLDGGWDMSTNSIPLDKTKVHLWTVWMKRLSTGLNTNGVAVWGLHTNGTGNVLNLAGTTNSDPRFLNAAIDTVLPTADKWYLLVGLVHENGYGTTDTNISGVYDPTNGTRVVAGTEFKYPSDTTAGRHRAYHNLNEQVSGEILQQTRPLVIPTTVADAPGVIKRLLVGNFYVPENRGTFWPRWLTRNRFYTAMNCRYRVGYFGQAIADMEVRHYIIDRIDGPSEGKLTLVAKDAFSKVEDKKALAPYPSTGELNANLTGSPGSFTLKPTGIGNLTPKEGGYSTITNVVEGYVRIGDEVLRVTRVNDVCTIAGRAQLGTIQEDHELNDNVQLVLSYAAQRVEDLTYDLLTGYTEVKAAQIDLPTWQINAAVITHLYTTHICEPTPVQQLIGELMIHAAYSVWPDVRTGMINFAALRAGSVSPIVTDRDWIIDKSIKTRRRTDKRVSRVLVHYRMRNYAGSMDDVKNFASTVLTPTDQDDYGSDVTIEIFSRWIPSGGQNAAKATGDRLINMFEHPPIDARFKLYPTKGQLLEEGRNFSLETDEEQDDIGRVNRLTMCPSAIKRTPDYYEIDAMSVRFGETTEDTVRRVIIETTEFNINMRSIYETQYPPPDGTEEVEIIVEETGIIGSTSVSTAAMRTGSWPSGTILRLINKGRIQGHGGTAGAGGSQNGFNAAQAGGPGGNGGDALLVERTLSIDNTGGKIWGGGGGGGGGGSAWSEFDIPPTAFFFAGGGGGGGGAGTNAGPGGNAGTAAGPGDAQNGSPGGAGTATSGGGGGNGVNSGGYNLNISGPGGAGGGPGQDGSPGFSSSVAPGSIGSSTAGGGPAGSAGKYVSGNSFVTWIATGDRLGNVS